VNVKRRHSLLPGLAAVVSRIFEGVMEHEFCGVLCDASGTLPTARITEVGDAAGLRLSCYTHTSVGSTGHPAERLGQAPALPIKSGFWTALTT
jgi:hypothetical protein